MNIISNTKIYGSFSKNPGNLGCTFFNHAFRKHNINAIYKSFFCGDLQKSIDAALTLGFSGFAISSPYKEKIFKVVEPYLARCGIDIDTVWTGMVRPINTVRIAEEGLYVYNTDLVACRALVKELPKNTSVYVVGNGGLGSVMYAAVGVANINSSAGLYQISRRDWKTIPDIKDSVIINCTPVDLTIDPSNILLDCRTQYDFGKKLHAIQAAAQFKIYTGIDYGSGPTNTSELDRVQGCC